MIDAINILQQRPQFGAVVHISAGEMHIFKKGLRFSTGEVVQAALGIEKYLDELEQSQFVHDYMALVSQIQMGEAQLSILHANPDQKTVEGQIQKLQEELEIL